MDPVGTKNSNGTLEETSVSSHSLQPKTSRGFAEIGFWLYLIALIVVLFVVRLYVVEPFIVQGPSMEPTFQNDNYLFVDRLTYHFEPPQRGSVIVFHLPENWGETLIKRVIGLPGDTVVLSGTAPTITIYNTAHPKGFILSEPYIAPQDRGGASNMSVTLGPDQYFVMGDNRVVSYDSRGWGVLPASDIIGRVLIRLFPFNEIGILPGKAVYATSTPSV